MSLFKSGLSQRQMSPHKMASHLETLPHRVLLNIAFYSFTSSSLDRPLVLQLLLISRTIYNALNIHTCPELYAQLFDFYFTLVPRVRLRASSPTDVSLAAELVQRFHVLRRIRLGEFSEQYIRTDLWTAYLMVLESDGHNEALLAKAGIAQYAFEFIRRHFREERTRHGSPLMSEVNSLAMWVACLTASHCEHYFF